MRERLEACLGFVLAAAIVVLAGASAASGADIHYGGVFELNFASLTDDAVDIGVDKSRFGVSIGAVVDVGMTPSVSLLTGLLYTQKGGEGKVFDTGLWWDTEINLDYLEVPAIAKISFADGKAYGLAGLSLAFNTKAEWEASSGGPVYSDDIKDEVEDVELALVLGGGASFDVGQGRLTAGLRYTIGLTEGLSDTITIGPSTTASSVKTQMLSISVAYMF